MAGGEGRGVWVMNPSRGGKGPGEWPLSSAEQGWRGTESTAHVTAWRQGIMWCFPGTPCFLGERTAAEGRCPDRARKTGVKAPVHAQYPQGVKFTTDKGCLQSQPSPTPGWGQDRSTPGAEVGMLHGVLPTLATQPQGRSGAPKCCSHTPSITLTAFQHVNDAIQTVPGICGSKTPVGV